MKKIISIGKVLLLTFLFVLGTSNRCFADVYISPTESFMWSYGSIIFIIEAILAVLFIISLVCMIIGEIGESDQLLSKSKRICENLFYYFIIIIGLIFAVIMFITIKPYYFIEWFSWDGFRSSFSLGEIFIMFLIGTLPLIFTVLSLFFRLKSKNKKNSYIILGIYLILIIFIRIWCF